MITERKPEGHLVLQDFNLNFELNSGPRAACGKATIITFAEPINIFGPMDRNT